MSGQLRRGTMRAPTATTLNDAAATWLAVAMFSPGCNIHAPAGFDRRIGLRD